MPKTRNHQTGRQITVECIPCYDEEGSRACIRHHHKNPHPIYNDPTNPALAPLTDDNPFIRRGKQDRDERKAMLTAFKKKYIGYYAPSSALFGSEPYIEIDGDLNVHGASAEHDIVFYRAGWDAAFEYLRKRLNG